MVTQIEIEGYEHDWLAVDAAGHVGFFATAGGGFAPQAFLDDLVAFESALAAILALPATTEAVCYRELPPHCIDTWKLAAERGFFAFDSSPNGGPYDLQAAPQLPVRIASLPTKIQKVVSRITLAGIDLHRTTTVTEAMLRESQARPM
jgi:hypothetical protein